MDIGSIGDLLTPEGGMLLLSLGAAFAFSLGITVITIPGLIRRMRDGGMVGRDVNKRGNVEVPELGGIAALFAFSISLSLIVGIKKLTGDIAETPYLAVIAVFFIAAMVGLIDDISNIAQRMKAVAVAFAALPLMLVHIGDRVALPFGYSIPVLPDTTFYLVFWVLLVPLGVTGVANAMNMSAGYNGLESGQITVVSAAMLGVLIFQGGQPDYSTYITAALVGGALGLYAFNRYPAKVFVGDIGTLGMGAALAGGIILGHIEVYGLIAILPAFFEAFATFYYSVVRKVPDRRHACHHPVILEDGRLQPPPGAERYTLAYWILSKKPMTEKQLVRVILALYAASGVAAIVLSVL